MHAIFQYLLNVFCARCFGANDYGLINYYASLISFFVAIGTLGFNGIITKKFAEDEENVGQYLGTTILSRIIFSIFSILILQVIILFSGENDYNINLIVFIQSLQILFGTGDLIIYWFRFKGKAKLVAIVRLFAFFLSAAWRIAAIALFDSLTMYIIGVSLESALFSILLIYFYYKNFKSKNFRFNKSILKQMLKLSYPFISSALLTTIYGQTDKVMLKLFFDSTSVALYSVSQTLAGAIVIIPTALIEGFRPDIMMYRSKNYAMYRKRLQQLYGAVFWICVSYCIFISFFSKQIILIIYGNEYIQAANSLACIVWYTSFSYFGAINNLYFVAENKTMWVQIITLIGAVINIVLNLILIPSMNILGAAIASLITQIITNFILMYFIKPLRDIFNIMIEGMLFKWKNQKNKN